MQCIGSSRARRDRLGRPTPEFGIMAHVFVRGFDHGTTLEQVIEHMSDVGSVINGELLNKGSAVLSFSSADEAAAAIEAFSGTIIPGNTRYIEVMSRKDGPGTGSGATKRSAASGGSHVFVRGFDHGTTYEQVISHMSSVGTVINGQLLDKGSAVLTYSSADEAAAALELSQSVIAGNTRYIDVMPRVDGPDTVGGGFPTMLTGAKRSAATEGSHVFVRGFDHGTTYDAVVAHMSTVGPVIDGELLDKGSAVLTYSSPDEAAAAVEAFSGTIIPGNTRYIDVMPRVDGPGTAKRPKQMTGLMNQASMGGNNAMMMNMMKMFMETMMSASSGAAPSRAPKFSPAPQKKQELIAKVKKFQNKKA